MKRLICILMVLVLSAGVFAGCNGGGDEKSGGGGAAGEKRVTYSLEGEAEELDPTLNNYSRSSIVLNNLYRGLFKLDLDNTPIKVYCEEYTVDETGTKYVFTLVDGAKWSDGSDLTAYDFEYAWKRVLDPETASKAAKYNYYLKNGKAYNMGEATEDMVGVKATDDKTLEVELEGPTAYFLDLLCTTSYFPVKKDLVETESSWTKTADTMISNGPFMMQEILPKEKYIMVKNPHYVKADNVRLDVLEMLILEDQQTQLIAYESGGLDVADRVTDVAFKDYKDNKPEEYYNINRIGIYYFDFNVSHEPFDNVLVRQAMSLAINRQEIVEDILLSDRKAAFGFIPYGIFDSTAPGVEFRDTAGNMFQEDISLAQQLLAEAGYPNGEGFPRVNLITMNLQEDLDVAVALQAMWKENLGIDIDISQSESKIHWSEQSEGNFDLCRDSWTGDFQDPLTMFETLDWPKQETESRWHNTAFTDLLQENRQIKEQDKRMENAVAAERILMDDMPVIPLYFLDDPYLCKPHVKGVFKNYIGHVHFEDAYIEE